MKFSFIREKIVEKAAGFSAALSLLGSWQVCHNACLLLISGLSVIGITMTGMPLLFLTKVAIPFWSLALLMLLVSFFMYIKKGCISKKMLTFNTGLIVAGVPFQSLQGFTKIFWMSGSIFIIIALVMHIEDKVKK